MRWLSSHHSPLRVLWRYAGLSDVPNARSAHSRVTPRGGAIGVLAALGICALALPHLIPNLNFLPSFTPFLSLVFAVGIVGLTDDAMTLPTGLKMLVLGLICALAVWAIGPVTQLPIGTESLSLPYVLGFVGSVLWLFTVTNIVNFMDGSNGLMGLSMSVAAFALFGISVSSGAPLSAVLALIVGAAIVGFLPYNFRARAKVFAGDVGSLVIGFTYAGLILLLISEAPNSSPVYAGPLLVLPFLADGLLTMARRAMRGERIWQAHNQHIYQRLIRGGRGHKNVAWIYGFLTLIMGNIVVYGATKGWLTSPLILIVPVILLSVIYIAASKRLPQ
ncbi:hypothetical protein AB8615_03360 [Litorimonas sp. RW-G-Af-16]|uniref:hypothetical protein n=1 Tax=Litorimonas sp. RW-G-Af-16 TaxID=3241168 RepID=UPI003AAF989E